MPDVRAEGFPDSLFIGGLQGAWYGSEGTLTATPSAPRSGGYGSGRRASSRYRWETSLRALGAGWMAEIRREHAVGAGTRRRSCTATGHRREDRTGKREHFGICG